MQEPEDSVSFMHGHGATASLPSKEERQRNLNKFMMEARAQALKQQQQQQPQHNEINDISKAEMENNSDAESVKQQKKELLEKHLAQFKEILSVQPQRHTEEQIQQERRKALRMQQQRQFEELELLRLKNKMEFQQGCLQAQNQTPNPDQLRSDMHRRLQQGPTRNGPPPFAQEGYPNGQINRAFHDKNWRSKVPQPPVFGDKGPLPFTINDNTPNVDMKSLNFRTNAYNKNNDYNNSDVGREAAISNHDQLRSDLQRRLQEVTTRNGPPFSQNGYQNGPNNRGFHNQNWRSKIPQVPQVSGENGQLPFTNDNNRNINMQNHNFRPNAYKGYDHNNPEGYAVPTRPSDFGREAGRPLLKSSSSNCMLSSDDTSMANQESPALNAQTVMCKQLVDNLFITRKNVFNKPPPPSQSSQEGADISSGGMPPVNINNVPIPPSMMPYMPQLQAEKGQIIPCALPLPFGMPMELPDSFQQMPPLTFDHPPPTLPPTGEQQMPPLNTELIPSASIIEANNALIKSINFTKISMVNPNQSDAPEERPPLSIESGDVTSSRTSISCESIEESSSNTAIQPVKFKLSRLAKPFVPRNSVTTFTENNMSNGVDIAAPVSSGCTYYHQSQDNSYEKPMIPDAYKPNQPNGFKRMRRPLKVINKNLAEMEMNEYDVNNGLQLNQMQTYEEQNNFGYDNVPAPWQNSGPEVPPLNLPPEMVVQEQLAKRPAKPREIGSGRIVFNQKPSNHMKRYGGQEVPSEMEARGARSKVGSGRTVSPRTPQTAQQVASQWQEDIAYRMYEQKNEQGDVPWRLPSAPPMKETWYTDEPSHADFIPKMGDQYFNNNNPMDGSDKFNRIQGKSSSRLFSKAISDLSGHDHPHMNKRLTRNYDA